MNKFSPLLVAGFLLAACGPSATDGSTTPLPSTTTATATPTIIPTSNPTIKLSPTLEHTPTIELHGFYPGLAPALDQFPIVEKADIPSYIEYLRTQPSLLNPDSPSPLILPIVVGSSGESYFTVECNEDGLVNCVPVASLQIAEQGLDIHIILWEIRNQDGSRGYLADYFYDSFQFTNLKSFERLVAYPDITRDYLVITDIGPDLKAFNPYILTLFQQPGYLQVNQEWIDTGNIPEALENMIVPMFNL
jgi:hypothetical protein